MSEHGTWRAPVLSLTVLDGASLDEGVVTPRSRVLVAVRSVEANRTHPNVVSVPTQRIPAALFDAIISAAPLTREDPVRAATAFDGALVDSRSDSGHDPVIAATEALMARKLGLGEALEGGRVTFRAALRSRVDGVAVYDNLGPELAHEPIAMLNVVVEMLSGVDDLPLRTTSYSLLAWTSVARFMRGIDARDPGVMSGALDPIELCVHGVCLDAAQASLRHLLGTRSRA